MKQSSPRRQAWSRIAILTPILLAILSLLGAVIIPSLGFQGVNTVFDGLFVAGIGGFISGLIGLGMVPRRRSSLVVSTRRPSITGGAIALSILLSGLLLMLSAVLASSFIH